MYEAVRERIPHLKGMGGWLAFLVVTLMVLWPLSGLIGIYESFAQIEQTVDVAGTAAWQKYKVVNWLLFIVSAVVSFLAGYRLYKAHDKESVHFAVYAIWFAGPVLSLAASMTGLILLNAPYVEGGLRQGLANIVFSVVAAALGTVYLKRSVRVKNTYNLPWYS